MKRILYSICIGIVAVAFTALGQPDRTEARGKDRQSRKANVKTAQSSKPGARAVKARGETRGQRKAASARTRMKAPAKRTVKTDRGRATRDRAVAKKSQDKPRRGVATIRERQVPAGREQTRTARGTKVARERSFAGGRAWQAARDRNVTIVNTWRDNRFAGAKYKAFRDYRKVYRDRAWYHRHYTRIIFMMGGWWYWNAGYWYPAWGYSRYSYYPYAGPIYTGYATLTPDRVVIEVQRELGRMGYDPGPMTRRALAAFQADHGLAITSAIDEPTLARLGVS